MRIKTLFILIPLLTAATARAEGIRYDRIPADVTGYLHVDMDRFVSSHLMQQSPDREELLALFNAVFGEHSDMTVFMPKSGGHGGYVMLLHTTDGKLRQRLESIIATPKTDVTLKSGDTEFSGAAITITYDQQEIHYTSVVNMSNVWELLSKKTLPPRPALATRPRWRRVPQSRSKSRRRVS